MDIPKTQDMRERIHALHAWYEGETAPLRLTSEVERLWKKFFDAGYNGHELARVIRFLKWEIAKGKRNKGSLGLGALLTEDLNGILRFSIDLQLASANIAPDKKPAPLPETEGVRPENRPHPKASARAPNDSRTPATAQQRAAWAEELRGLSQSLRQPAPSTEEDQ